MFIIGLENDAGEVLDSRTAPTAEAAAIEAAAMITDLGHLHDGDILRVIERQAELERRR